MQKVLAFRLASLLILATTTCLLGCPAAEVAQTETALEGALAALTQNRTMTEQFVREFKTKVGSDNPAYIRAMELYGDARETYNRYLDAVESDEPTRNDRSVRNCSPDDVAEASIAFMSEATRAMYPLVDQRSIPFKQGVTVPANLQSTFGKVPKKARRNLVDDFDHHVRWRKWSDL